MSAVAEQFSGRLDCAGYELFPVRLSGFLKFSSAMIAKRRNADKLLRRKIGFVSPICVQHRKQRVVTADADSRSRPNSRTAPLFRSHFLTSHSF